MCHSINLRVCCVLTLCHLRMRFVRLCVGQMRKKEASAHWMKGGLAQYGRKNINRTRGKGSPLRHRQIEDTRRNSFKYPPRLHFPQISTADCALLLNIQPEIDLEFTFINCCDVCDDSTTDSARRSSFNAHREMCFSHRLHKSSFTTMRGLILVFLLSLLLVLGQAQAQQVNKNQGRQQNNGGDGNNNGGQQNGGNNNGGGSSSIGPFPETQFCKDTGLTPSDGTQIKNGACSSTPMGAIPTVNKMVTILPSSLPLNSSHSAHHLTSLLPSTH